MIEIAIGYVLLINLFAFSLFGIDKRKAVKRKWRIPEATLLTVAALGGAGRFLECIPFIIRQENRNFMLVCRHYLWQNVWCYGIYGEIDSDFRCYGWIEQ